MTKGVYATASGGYQVVLVRAWTKGKPSTRRYFGTFESKPAAQALAKKLIDRYPTKATIRKRKLYHILQEPTGGVKDTIPTISTSPVSSSSAPPSPAASACSSKRRCHGGKEPRHLALVPVAEGDSSSGTDREE